MISQLLNRQGFGKSLSGISGSAIQSAYIKPVVASNLVAENASWSYPLGDPWGWGIYPWNWGKEGKSEEENATPETPTPGAQGGIPESPGGNVLMFLAVVGAAWFLVFYKR